MLLCNAISNTELFTSPRDESSLQKSTNASSTGRVPVASRTPLEVKSPMPATRASALQALSVRDTAVMHLLPEKEFVDRVLPLLPHRVARFYLELRMSRKMAHKCAYSHTLQTAKLLGLAVGLPGLPAHESRLRLLLRSET